MGFVYNSISKVANLLERSVHGQLSSIMGADEQLSTYGWQAKKPEISSLKVKVTNTGLIGKLLVTLVSGSEVLDSTHLPISKEANVKLELGSTLDITEYTKNTASLDSAFRAIFGENISTKIMMRFIPVTYVLHLSLLQDISTNLKGVDGIHIRPFIRKHMTKQYLVEMSESKLFNMFPTASTTYVEDDSFIVHAKDPGFLAFANVAGSDNLPKELDSIEFINSRSL